VLQFLNLSFGYESWHIVHGSKEYLCGRWQKYMSASQANDPDAGTMDINISPVDGCTVQVEFFIAFVDQCLLNHIELVKNKEYRRLAFSSSNKNNFKKYFEEIVPLRFYLETVRNKYHSVTYMSGDQSGDALLNDSVTVEITKAQNTKRHLVTQDMQEFGYAYSPKKVNDSGFISVPTRTKPYAYTNFEHVEDLQEYIHLAIDKKAKGKYPLGSVLIVLFQSDTLMLDWDYEELTKKLNKINKQDFAQIYFIENFIKDDLKPKWEFAI
jgi:hypothetical protein